MEKKKYVKPTMQVYEMPDRQMILCLSDAPLNHIPTIPGQPRDEKHLA